MEKQRFFCWTLKTWAYIVAWTHIIINVLTTVLGTVGIVFWLSSKYEVTNYQEIAVPIYLFLSILAVLLAIYLLLGVKTGNPNRLNTWLIITFVLMAASAAGIIVGIVTGDLVVLSEFVDLALSIFGIWIIYRYRDELIEQENQSQSQLQNQVPNP